MKVKVLRTFSYKKHLYTTNQIVDITKAEEEHMNSSNAGLLVEALDTDCEVQLRSMTKKELLDYALKNNISVNPKDSKENILKELK